MIIVLFSASFVGGSAAVPVTMATVGVVLMVIGKRFEKEDVTNGRR